MDREPLAVWFFYVQGGHAPKKLSVNLGWGPRGPWVPGPGAVLPAWGLWLGAQLARLSADGFAACCLDYRGVGGLPLKSGRLGAMDSWRDLAQVLEARGV